MSKVFVNIGLSLDGYMAPEGMTMGNPEYKNWGAKWGAMMSWLLKQQHFRENVLKMGAGGETGPVNDLVRRTTERIGANIMGKRMFDQGEVAWPEEAPFHTPVYVLTHDKREPWERPGGTTFHFVNEGPLRALELARKAAGTRDIRIAGGADVIQQYLNLGVIDELEIALAPVLFGGMEPFARTIDAKKKYVVSRTLDRVDWNAELLRGDLREAVQRIKQQPGKGILVGGVALPQALAEMGLIDEYEFVVHPRVAGHGPTLFQGLSKPLDLKLVSRLEYGSGAVAMRYELKK